MQKSQRGYKAPCIFNIKNYYIFNNILVNVDNLDKINDTKSKLENDIEAAIAVTDRNSSASYEAYNSEIEEGSTYSFVFTMLFLLIAILSVVTTMHRFVKKQRTQIGTLKALGFKNGKIIFHYGYFVRFWRIGHKVWEKGWRLTRDW